MIKKTLISLLSLVVLVGIGVLYYQYESQVNVYSLGETARGGSLEITVNNIEKTKLSFTEEESENVKQNAFEYKYEAIILDVTIKNSSNKNMVGLAYNNFSASSEIEDSLFLENDLTRFANDFKKNNLLNNQNIFPHKEVNGILVFRAEPCKNVRFVYYPNESDQTGFAGAFCDLTLK